ncbi:YgjP-like metallopeptidase domain-containing protein [Methylophilus sp.]|jgi:UTP pyrophosphatase|uniref:M48 metallopeptidase family protein n=1 Tax=Methylophilus sp. TaxID=29541 RepID=UPI0011D55A96|nr:YgjP-like metallopeptidase domain-containing protein [Methylophilus sp.]TXI45916.1 MAG: M48 family peptidase [Methylophilus sp.]
MTKLPYLNGYPAELIARIEDLLEQDQLGDWLKHKYSSRHDIQTDKALYQYVTDIKQQYIKNSSVLAKVAYDSQQHPMKGTLGTNTFVSRVQGGKLKSKNEIHIAALFRETPEAFLRVIVIHELSHLKEKDHNKAFYKLCCHMEPDYHQLEFDLRVWLTWRDLS